eukprot:gnl/MRDRNA2_/MRDRNA2_101116_c0_seq1.p1 gnl/MRDRNA2_/MRDRNA2_101116_c0~~gnl/MRDRNA2_/MRDRNA2_101116_c0_seq1.p1  ORF type:complete len:330 (+),score=37.46 gnl/MRDRNA2_/MRDRNA2_101116_c0_seq1:151-1140(+)
MVMHGNEHAHALLSVKGVDNWHYWSELFSDPSPEVYFWLGIGIMLMGNTLSAIGLLIQKYAHKDGATEWTSYFCSPTWLCGFSIFIIAQILCWLSLALAPQAVLACLTCWSTVVTCVVAPLFLDETVTVFRLMSVLIMIFGCTWVIFSGPRVYSVFTVEILIAQSQNILFLVISGVTLVYLIGCAIKAALSKSTPRLTALQYTILAATIGWYSVLTAKITSGLFFSSWHHTHNQFDRWESWVMVVLMISLAVTNLHFLNMALSIGDAVFVVPMYEAMAIFGQTLLGGIFFKEFQELDWFAHVNFWFGLSVILLGVVLLARKGPDSDFYQ